MDQNLDVVWNDLIQSSYAKMQQRQYEAESRKWSPDNRDPVVGSFDAHNSWLDYDIFLFKNIKTTGKIALDFGCGPGRGIVHFANRFSRIDGVDIARGNLLKANTWIRENGLEIPGLFHTNGRDLASIGDHFYDVVYSTICLQHICVHSIRFNLMREFFRVLRPGGAFCAQMGFGIGTHPSTVSYMEDHVIAQATNGACDTRVEDPNQLKVDLTSIGFRRFTYDIQPVGPGDRHPNWIFFRAIKPK